MPKKLGYANGGNKKSKKTHKGRPSKKKGRTSKAHKVKKKRAKMRAKKNIARMMGESPNKVSNGYKSEKNKKVNKPKFKRNK